jgi:hypothetical protein
MAPSAVNNVIRQNMKAVRDWFIDPAWVDFGYTYAYVGATQFKVAGVDVSANYPVGRRVRAIGSSTGTIYGTITVVAFSTDTTVTVVWDSGSLSNETLAISTGFPSLGFGMSMRNLFNGTTTIASATTTDLGTAKGNTVIISGTTTITAFGSTANVSNPIYFGRFSGALTLTHNATSLILPSSANITTANGDSFIAEYLGSGNWKVLGYFKVNGNPLNTGTSGATVPLLDGNNTFSGTATFNSSVTIEKASEVLFRMRATDTTTGTGKTQIRLAQYNGSSSPIDMAAIRTSSSDVTAGSEDGIMELRNIVAGSLGVKLVIGDGVYTPSATGGDKGVDTINAKAVYDDNVLLTCYVADAVFDGSVNLDFWNSLAPNWIVPIYENVTVEETDENGDVHLVRETLKVGDKEEEREHFGARKFAERLGTEYDPLDLDKYWKHFEDKRHLTSMPSRSKFDAMKGISTGEIIQRLWETVEIQAVHIHKLNERLKALEVK